MRALGRGGLVPGLVVAVEAHGLLRQSRGGVTAVWWFGGLGQLESVEDAVRGDSVLYALVVSSQHVR